ncbi:hypothetical protein FHW96_004855 [Novosphingobium sp. SG751A]|uniref:hypothetical protein n=1 Tax=Novosphingobium sp. SG751A TaxID=2587000 RepID=UPI001552E1A1|nr:hypothetical protein [Novosphingobium sp. SG751A]NOW48665.1 hypothetical protein [Novosphingobium sp. SG751A]
MKLVGLLRRGLSAFERFLKALDYSEIDPIAEQQRRIVCLEARIQRLEVRHDNG